MYSTLKNATIKGLQRGRVILWLFLVEQYPTHFTRSITASQHYFHSLQNNLEVALSIYTKLLIFKVKEREDGDHNIVSKTKDEESAKDVTEEEFNEDFDCFCKVCQMAFASDSVLSQHNKEIHETI